MRQPQSRGALPARILLAGVVLLTLARPGVAEFRLPPSDAVQTQVAIATDARGGMVIVWREQFRSSAQPLNTLRFQRFDPSGEPAGGTVRVDELPGDNGRNPALDVAADRSFVVVWEGGPATGSYRRTVWAQRFSPKGKPRGPEIRVTPAKMLAELDAVSPRHYGAPAVSIAPDGSFVVVWRDDGTRSCNFGNIIARRYSASGKPLGEVFRVNPELRLTHLAPAVDHDAEGNFVIVWQRSTMAGTVDEQTSIHGQRFDAVGRLVGDVFTVQGGDGRANAPALAVDSDGSFLVAWLDRRRGADRWTLLARESGGRIVEIATERISEWSLPSVARTTGGDFTIAWSARNDDAWTGSKIWVRRLGGQPRQVGPATCTNRVLPSIAPLPSNGLAIVWHAGYGFELEGARIGADENELPSSGFAPTVAERVRSLTADLKEDDERLRRYGAERIGCFRLHASDAAPRLFEMASGDPSLEVRRGAAVSLAQVAPEPKRVLPFFVAATEDEDAEMKAAAARGLGILGLADGAMPLWKLQNPYMQKQSPAVRARALSALVDIGDQEHLVEVLRSRLEDPDLGVRSAAAAGLLRLPEPLPDTADLILDAWKDETYQRYPLMLVAHLGPAAAPALPKVQKILSNPEQANRIDAIKCLTAMRQPVFASLLRDPMPLVRTEAAKGLRKLGVNALAPAEAILAEAGERETDAKTKTALDAAWHAWTEAECLEPTTVIR